PGEAVAEGEPLVDVETDKATVVYEAEQAGVLAEIAVEENGTAALGAVIARLAVEGDAPPAAPPPDEAPAAAEPVGEATVPDTAPPRASGSRPRGTPVARRLAEELGVELS